MANITLTVVVEDLVNDELDMVADKYHKFMSDHEIQLPGKVSEVTEADREEDEETNEE